MSEALIKFDSRNEEYKRPFGAVTGGTEVFLRVKVRADIVVKRAVCVVKYDRHFDPAQYEMKCEKDVPEKEKYSSYTVKVKYEDTGLYWYHFEIETDLGYFVVSRSGYDDLPVVIDRGYSNESPATWQQTVYRRHFEEPSWIHGGIFYHIFVDRFAAWEPESETAKANKRKIYEDAGKILRDDWGGMPRFRPNKEGRILNNDFFGGDLKGITEKLPYLEELGVTCLYLSPVFEAYSNHKYDTADYMRIDPAFGSDADFAVLCIEAGKRGIRVILDGVFAHTGSDSLYFNKYGTYGKGGAWNDPQSFYRKWYTFYDDGKYDCWWGIDTLPKVNKRETSYVEFISGRDGVARFWLRMGAAGWRLDVADELPVSFMKILSDAVHKEKSDALLIGEVWEDASNKSAYDERKNYFEGDKLDSVMNYPLKDAIIGFVRERNSHNMAMTAERLMENYPPFAVNCLMNNLGTHDSIRIMTALAGKKIEPCLETREEQAACSLTGEEYKRGVELLKMASLLQMTLPGVPCIYYGDEAGMQGYSDPFNRGCYPWGNENKELQEWYRRLIKIRRENAIYKEGGYRTIACDDGMYAFARTEGDEEMITAVNRSRKMRKIPLEGVWEDLLTGNRHGIGVMLYPDEMLLLKRVEKR